MIHMRCFLNFAFKCFFLCFATCNSLIGQSHAIEPVHAYLLRDEVIHYSLESAKRAFVRRVTVSLADSQCRLARVPTYRRLPEQVNYPIRIKEAGAYCWSIWPSERVKLSDVPPKSKRPALTPDFVGMRINRDAFEESTIPLQDASSANWGEEIPKLRVEAKYARDYPITAMYRSRYTEMIDVDGAPTDKTPFPVSRFSADFPAWAKSVQKELDRFASYDLLIDRDGGCQLFLVMEGNDNQRYIMPPSKNRRMYELQVIPSNSANGLWTWRVVDHYPSDFVEHFFVIDSNGQRWFATGKGELYRLEGRGDERAVRQVKVRNDQQVLALLEEPGDPGRCFAFTSKSWFELKEPIEYHDFELGSFQSDAPMPTLIRCATEIRKRFPSLPNPAQK